jgi:DNA oxidative demethylase
MPSLSANRSQLSTSQSVVGPNGFRLYEDVLSRGEEEHLIKSIRDLGALHWERVRMRGQLTKRKTLSYGWAYKVYSRCLVAAPRPPQFLKAIRKKCCDLTGGIPEKFDQVTIINYPSGSSIGPHIDAPCFGPVVMGLSLLSSCCIAFTRPKCRPIRFSLPPRSLTLLEGESRNDWQHQITGIKGERLSLVFRSAVTRGEMSL